MQKKFSFSFMKCFRDLFKLNRSLTGEGTLKTLKYFIKINKKFKIIRFRSNQKVFDWKVPLEWNIKNGYIEHIETGKRFCELKKNNLHIVNYSIPVKKVLDLKVLKKNLYFDKKIKNAIPYITSYYKQNWGFCISKKEFNSLPRGKYKILINSSFKKGYMNGAELIIPGKSKYEIFFSSYICHPSMANNELSGPILLNSIAKYIGQNFEKNYYTYRFVLLPETIGSIAYLSKNYKKLKKNVIAAYNLSCVGDNRFFSLIQSRKENSISDQSIKCQLLMKKKYKIYSFLERGSDERQYCYPGIDLPMATFCRSKFGTYKEYHTSKDNLKIVSEKNMYESFNIFKNIIDSLEIGMYPKNSILCEPMLSKRGLYPTLSKKENYQINKKRMNFLAYCDGSNLFEISLKTNISLEEILKEYKILLKNKVLKNYYHKFQS